MTKYKIMQELVKAGCDLEKLPKEILLAIESFADEDSQHQPAFAKVIVEDEEKSQRIHIDLLISALEEIADVSCVTGNAIKEVELNRLARKAMAVIPEKDWEKCLSLINDIRTIFNKYFDKYYKPAKYQKLRININDAYGNILAIVAAN